MTPKEKAIELVEKYLNKAIHFPYIDTVDGYCVGSGYMIHNSSKGCALIAVDEILKEYSVLQIETSFCYKQYLYWQEVKQEIEKL